MTVGQAARELGITPSAVRTAINEGRLTRILLHARTSLIARAEVQRYRREHLGRQGKRPQPDALTEQQRKQRAYQQAYYQRRKAARQQQPAAQGRRGQAAEPEPAAVKPAESSDTHQDHHA
jgi:hypothetical protein